MPSPRGVVAVLAFWCSAPGVAWLWAHLSEPLREFGFSVLVAGGAICVSYAVYKMFE